MVGTSSKLIPRMPRWSSWRASNPSATILTGITTIWSASSKTIRSMCSTFRISGEIALTAGAAQSGDGKAVYVQLDLAGHIGTALAHDSTQAVRDIVGRTQPPSGVKAYVTGPAAISTDMRNSGDSTVKRITTVSLLVIFVMLLLVYRSVFTVVLLLLMVAMSYWLPGDSWRSSAITGLSVSLPSS